MAAARNKIKDDWWCFRGGSLCTQVKTLTSLHISLLLSPSPYISLDEWRLFSPWDWLLRTSVNQGSVYLRTVSAERERYSAVGQHRLTTEHFINQSPKKQSEKGNGHRSRSLYLNTWKHKIAPRTHYEARNCSNRNHWKWFIYSDRRI